MSLQAIYEDLGEVGHDVCLLIMPRFAIHAHLSLSHMLRYEDLSDDVQALIDAGEAGMADPLKLDDVLERLDTLNGHLASLVGHADQTQAALYTADDEALADVVKDIVAGGGSEWTAEDIAEFISILGQILAAL